MTIHEKFDWKSDAAQTSADPNQQVSIRFYAGYLLPGPVISSLSRPAVTCFLHLSFASKSLRDSLMSLPSSWVAPLFLLTWLFALVDLPSRDPPCHRLVIVQLIPSFHFCFNFPVFSYLQGTVTARSSEGDSLTGLSSFFPSSASHYRATRGPPWPLLAVTSYKDLRNPNYFPRVRWRWASYSFMLSSSASFDPFLGRRGYGYTEPIFIVHFL